MIKRFKKINSVIVLIFIIPFLLNIIWFKDGNIMGYAESGLPFYNFNIAYEANKNTWNQFALGFPTNISIASKPTYWVGAQLQNIGIPSFILQAIFFWIVLVVSGLSVFLLTKNLFHNLSNKFILLSVLFYWFNPFSMVNVWNRFLNNFLFFYMLLPVCFLFFVKGLNDKRYHYAVLIGLVSTIFSYALTSVAFNILLWVVLIYTTGFYIFILKKANERLFVVKFFIVTLLFWCMTNLWWISQVFSYVYSGSFLVVEQTSFSLLINQQIFTNLSQKLGNLIYILRFQHASFFNHNSNIIWINLYIFPPIAYLSFMIPIIIFLPIFIKRNISSLFLIGLIIFGIFLSKGNNPPFGEILDLAFNKAGFLQPFRNAFEKFGFILPLAGAPLFGYGVYILTEKLQKWGKYLYMFTVFWITIMFGFPFWTGLVFTNNEMPTNIPQVGYQVRVPEYYKNASDWLSSQSDNFRLLVFPIGGEGITYNWEKGYSGVELSNQLLPKTSVSLQTNVPFYENISGDLEKAFMAKGDFTKVTNILNAKYIMSRNDVNWHARAMRDPLNITKQLEEKKDQFKMIDNFGTLFFWENLKWVDRGIYASNNVISISPKADIPDAQFLTDDAVFLSDKIPFEKITVSQYIVHPIARFTLGSIEKPIPKSGQDVFPHAKYSPGSKIYKLILLKERFDLNNIPLINNKVVFVIQLLGKRLVEAKKEAALNKEQNVILAIDEYDNLLKILSSFSPEYSIAKSDFDKQIINQEGFYDVFTEHKKILADLVNNFSDKKEVVKKVEQTQELLDTTLIKSFIQPTYGFREWQEYPVKNRIVYKFNVKKEGGYELLWGSNLLDKYYKKHADNNFLQIDDQIVPVTTNLKESGIKSFEKIYLNQGMHEISMNAEEGINLVESPQEMNLQVNHGETKKTFPIKDYDPFASYTLSFDYFIKTGSGVEFSMETNNAKVSLGRTVPDYLKFFWPDSYDFGEKHFSGLVKLGGSADSATLILKVYPWNNCESIYFAKGKSKCEKESFRSPYDRTTEVTVKNVSVTRNFVDEPVLLRVGNLPTSIQPEIKYSKINNTKYLVKVTDAKNPYILVLSELFDPGWEVISDSGNKISDKHFLVNAYANGWEISKPGNYELTVKYAPQDLLNPTLKISLLTTILGVLFLMWRMRK